MALSSLPCPLTSLLDVEDACDISDSESEYSQDSSDGPASPETPTNQPLELSQTPHSQSFADEAHSLQPWSSPFQLGKDSAEISGLKNSDGLPTPAETSTAFAEWTETWLRERAVERYNSRLMEFRSRLEHHLAGVDRLITATNDAQANRYTCLRPRMCGVNGHAKVLDRLERIKRLKARGWERELFDPTKSGRLCDEALAEL